MTSSLGHGALHLALGVLDGGLPFPLSMSLPGALLLVSLGVEFPVLDDAQDVPLDPVGLVTFDLPLL